MIKSDNVNNVKQAIKIGAAIKVDSDVYLTDDNRVLTYDRYFKKNPNRAAVCGMWIDEIGNCFENFFNAYYEMNAWRWAKEG